MFSEQAKKQKGGMPEFLNYYGKLFEKSKIMERIMPRTVNNQELKEHFPFLFTEYNHKQFSTADVEGINKVTNYAL